jgi:hypothetical protein
VLERLNPDGELLLVHSVRKETKGWSDLYGEGGAEGLHGLYTKYLRMRTLVSRRIEDYQIDLITPDPEFNGEIPGYSRLTLMLSNTWAVLYYVTRETGMTVLGRARSLLGRLRTSASGNTEHPG